MELRYLQNPIRRKEIGMIYKNIKEAAEKQKLSINSLEDKISVSHGSICKWDRNRPSVDKVKAVADILGVSIEELLVDREEDT